MRRKVRSFFVLLVPGLLFCAFAQGQTEVLGRTKVLVQQKKFKEALELIDKTMKSNPQSQESDLFNFQKALISIEQNDSAAALAFFSETHFEKSSLKDYAAYYRGTLLRKLNQTDQALVEFRKVDLKESSLQLKVETQFQMSEVFLSQKKFGMAAPLLRPLLKQARGTSKFPDVLYNLAILEKGLNNHTKKCDHLRKLYVQFPGYSKTKDWTSDLFSSSFDGLPTKCTARDEDFRQRLKNWLWSGEEKEALTEIAEFRKKFGQTQSLAADQMQAQFELQAGEPQKAFELLKPHLEKHKGSIGFLLLFASTAARAAEVQTAVATYYQVYKLSPKSTKGRSALYQSAFLSYQSQDYDGAQRRFQEFVKQNRGSKLASEALWHLAWLKYLKSDYAGAYKAMKALTQQGRGRKSQKKAGQDRLRYWMSVSLLKQGLTQQAKVELQKLSRDPLMGYYALAAQTRLKKIAPSEGSKKLALEGRKSLPRFSVAEVMQPSIDDYSDLSEAEGEGSEAEVMQALEDTKTETEDNPEEVALANSDQKSSEDETPVLPSLELKNLNLVRKFERSRDLIILGQTDWAKWELYDIEKKTRNKDHLKALMSEYVAIDFYHRSSYIGQVYFSSWRAQGGIEGMRNIWEFAYPQAYEASVKKSSKESGVSREYIYAIMKAESSFRKDAISPVGALGLMQVMPFTGRKVADLYGIKNFESSQLLQPEVAIQVGSHYLQRLLKKFDQVFPLVAASYNAGPHRVKSWLNNFGYLETDEFIEHIPFLETRNYVKKVMANANIYSHLYNQSQNSFPYLADILPFKYNEKAPTKETWEDL